MECFEYIKKLFRRASKPIYCDIYEGDSDKYLARHIIMGCLEKPLDGEQGISPKSNNHVHLVCVGADPLMLNIARQVALVCHFPNFDDEHLANRTKITILSSEASTEEGLIRLKEQMASESVLGNLLEECPFEMSVSGTSIKLANDKKDSFIDIEIEVIGFEDGNGMVTFLSEFKPTANELATIVIHADTVKPQAIETLQSRCHQVHVIDDNDRKFDTVIDIRKAAFANIVYKKGYADRNIYDNNADDANEYSRHLRKLIRKISNKEANDSWNGMSKTDRLSNVFYTDCYPYYCRSLVSVDNADLTQALINGIDIMSRTEHARWNVEKLIMGFRTLTPEEIVKDESLTGKDKKDYRKSLKTSKAHIDICSMKRLRCVDTEALKYDSFLLLAMPSIIETLKK